MDAKPPPLAASSSSSSKLRLMCSYGGHILPRPHDKTLFYAGGETRIVALDRRTTAASLSALAAHISRAVFQNRLFYLKYQLPNEDLDSLISVITDEDLLNMIDEHDRIVPPARIRLFLFPVKPESLGSTLLDPKSESWFCDALKSTRILPKGQSADSGMLMGLGSDLDVPMEGAVGGGGGEDRHGAESLVLETSLSFGSTSSSVSMSNSPPIGIVQCEDNGSNLLERKIRVPSSASIESDNSVGSAAAPSQIGIFQEPLIQVAQEASSFVIESESVVTDPSFNTLSSKPVEVLGYPLSQQSDGKQLRQEKQCIQGGLQYVPQYPANPIPISPYYPVYQMPAHQQHITCPQNQPYPIYLVPVRPTQYHNLSMQCNFVDTNNISPSSRPPLHPQTAVVTPLVTHKEVFGAQAVAELATKSYRSSTPTDIPSSQDQLVMAPHEHPNSSEPVAISSLAPTMQGGDFDEDIAYNPIYKTQPPPPALPSQYQTMIKGTTVMFSESSVQRQPNNSKQHAALHSQ